MSLKSCNLKETNKYEIEVFVDAETFEAAVQKSYKKNIGKINKTAIIVWTIIAISFIYSNVQSICELNEYTEWKVLLRSPTELKEGDWDGWTTEEDLKKLEEPDWDGNE